LKIEITATFDKLNNENQELMAMLDSNRSQVQNMRSALDNPALSGKTYETVSNRLTQLRIPAAQAHALAFDELHKSNCMNIAALGALPESSPGVLDVDELESVRSNLTDQNNQIALAAQRVNASNESESWLINRYDSLINLNNSLIKIIDGKIAAAHTYDSQSRGFYWNSVSTSYLILDQSCEAISSFISTGTIGDTSWTKGLDKLYERAQQEMYDRMALQISRDNEEVAFISSDYKFIYYNGEKWPILSPSTSVTYPSLSFVAPYQVIDVLPYERNVFNLGHFLRNFGGGGSNSSPSNGGLAVNQDNVQLFNSTSLVLGEASNFANSFESYNVMLTFSEDCNGNRIVSLVSREDRFLTEMTSTLGLSSIHFTPDPIRNDPNTITTVFYFNEQGELYQFLPRYPKDRVEIINFLNNPIDITETTFNNSAGPAGSYYSDWISGTLEEIK